MAEQTEITNVGGEGVASEVTLANLLAVTEQMAKKAGVDPKDVTKKLKALSTATQDTIKVSTKNRDALGKNTKAVDKSTSAFKKLSGAVGGALLSSISAVARSGTEMTRAFINGETSLTAFAGQLPLIGNQLSILTGLFDNTFTAFQNVATSGAAFNNSLTDLRNAAAGARMPLEEFASMVGANTDKLAALGGTATQGAQQIVALNRALGSNRNDLLNMGLNYQEINESLIDYQYLQRAGNRGVRLSQAQTIAQAEAAADYTKNLVTLGKLTGEDVKSQQAKIAQAQMDVAMQAKLATMSIEERQKMDLLMADTLASGGQAAVDALKREFLGMPPMTEEAALYTSQFGENINSIARRLESVYDANVKAADMAAGSTDYMVDMIMGNAAAFARLEPGLTAAAAGLDGPMATIADQLRQAGIQFTDFIDADTGKVDEVRLRAALDSAKKETDARDATTNSVATFMDTLKTLQEAFQTQIVSPLMNAVAPAFDAIVKALQPDLDDDGNPIEGSGFLGAITKIGNYINNELAPGILKFIEAFKEDPKKAILDLFSRGTASLTNVIKDFFLGPQVTTMGPNGPEVEREGGFLKETLLPIIGDLGTMLVNGMVEGVKYLWENTNIIETMVAGIAALWAGKALIGAMATGAASLLAAGARRISSAPLPRGATVPTPGATPSRTPTGPDGGRGGSRLGNVGRMLGRGAKFIPGVGLIAAGAMGAFDAASGFSADPNAGLGERLGNAGSSALSGLTFGLLGRSPDEIAAESAANQNNTSQVESPDTNTAPDSPTVDSPGAQLAMLLTPEQIGAMERLAAINLNTFNTGLSTLLATDLSAFRTMSRLDITGVAEGFRTFAEIPDLSRNVNTINSLDADSVRNYTQAMEGLVEALSNLNDELSRDNDTLFTSRADAGELLSGISTSTSGTSRSTEQLNNTMQQVLTVLNEMRDLDIDVEKNTRNIIGSNLAQGGVSNVSR